MNKWRVASLLALLLLIAVLSYAFHAYSMQKDPLNVLKRHLADPRYAIEFIERGTPSFYVKISMIGDQARRGDVAAMRAIITVSEFVWGVQDKDFLSYWLAEIASSQPELFLALCSRMGEDASKTIEMAAQGMSHYGKPECDPAAFEPLLQAAKEMGVTSAWMKREVRKACRVESMEEAEGAPGEPG